MIGIGLSATGFAIQVILGFLQWKGVKVPNIVFYPGMGVGGLILVVGLGLVTLGLWRKADLHWQWFVRRGDLAVPPPASRPAIPAPKRPAFTPFTRYNVEWVDGLAMQCPVHHTPLMFWPVHIMYDRHMARPRPRAVTDNDRPFVQDYSRDAGALWCVDGGEEIRFPVNMTVAEAKHLIRVSLQGATNRGEMPA